MGLDEGMDLKEEGRLRSFLLQLRVESGILDRMVYKNKNQHRRCPYFQSILKVRRDVRLLLSVRLEEILKPAFQVIHGKDSTQRVRLLERIKERHSSGKHNFQERLLGVARLLSQMVEPILRAAVQISYLLAKSFFMGFSLTILSLLARLRVLVQQMLVDTVSVFNRVSSLSQKKHAVKLIKNGIEAFREYYPPYGEIISLDCSWQGDKFVLHERTHVSRGRELEDVGVAPLEAPDVQYETLEASDEDHEAYSGEMHKNIVMEDGQDKSGKEDPEAHSGEMHKNFVIKDLASPLNIRNASDTYEGAGDANCSDCKDEENTIIKRSFAESPYKVDSGVTGASSSSSQILHAPSTSRKKVAFVAVKETSEPKKMRLDVHPGSNALDINGTQDSFFKLLTGGSMTSSLFD